MPGTREPADLPVLAVKAGPGHPDAGSRCPAKRMRAAELRMGSSPLSADLIGGGEVIRERLFELEEADRVLVRVGEPGREREPDVGDAVNGVQIREILDLGAPRPEFGDLAGDAVHAPGGLGGAVGRAGAALGDDQPAVAPASEGEELLVFEQHLEPGRAAVEPAGRTEVGREQHHVHRVITEQGSLLGHEPAGSSPPAGYSHLRSSLVTRGMTTQVISDTVTSVVTASRGTSGSLPSSGADATTTRVIRGKIV